MNIHSKKQLAIFLIIGITFLVISILSSINNSHGQFLYGAGDPEWCGCADVNGDLIINIDDIALIADHWTG